MESVSLGGWVSAPPPAPPPFTRHHSRLCHTPSQIEAQPTVACEQGCAGWWFAGRGRGQGARGVWALLGGPIAVDPQSCERHPWPALLCACCVGVLCAVCCAVLCAVLCCVWAAMDAGGGAHGTGPLPKPPEPPPGPAPQPPPGVEHQGSTTVTRTCSLSKALNASLPLLEDWVAWMGPDASLPALKGREGQQDPRLALGAYIDAEVLAMGAVTQRGSRFLEMWLRILASANDAPMPPPPPPAASASAGSASSAGGPPAPLPEGPLPEYREFMDPSFRWDLAINSSHSFHTVEYTGPRMPQAGYQAAVDR